ncbi:hypothetical protein AB2C67_33800, partial [Pseudomonas aeruginosa]
MKIAGNDLIKPGRYALIRNGTVAMAGPMVGMADHYRPGDILVVSVDTYEALRETAALAAPSPPPARGR